MNLKIFAAALGVALFAGPGALLAAPASDADLGELPVAPPQATTPATPRSNKAVKPAADDDSGGDVDAAPAPAPKKKKVKPAADDDASDDTPPPPPPKKKKKVAKKKVAVPPALPDDDDASAAPPATTAARRRAAAARAAAVDDAPPPPPAPPATVPAQPGRDGMVRVVVPNQRHVRAVTLYLEDTGGGVAVVEDQASAVPNSLVNIGRGRSLELDFDGSKVLDKRGIESLAAVFYVYSGVLQVKEMEITPTFLKKGDDIIDSGETPALFKVEVLELDRIGDTDGTVLKTFDGISFRIGQVNPIPLNVEVATGKKLGVRISIPEDRAPSETLFLQLKAAKKGKFPVNIVATQAGAKPEKRVAYGPQVRFSYIPNANDVDTFADPAQSLIGQINKYVERHAQPGQQAIAVPLRVKVEYR